MCGEMKVEDKELSVGCGNPEVTSSSGSNWPLNTSDVKESSKGQDRTWPPTQCFLILDQTKKLPERDKLKRNTKSIIHKRKKCIHWTSSKLKTLALRKTLLWEWKRQATNWWVENICKSHFWHRLVFRIYKELSTINKKTNLLKMSKRFRHFIREAIQMGNGTWKDAK